MPAMADRPPAEQAIGFDPDSHAIQDDPYPVYRALREREPWHRHPSGRFWALSRYDDVVAALRRPDLFSSRRSLDGAATDPAAAFPMIVIMDPPRHDELRSLMHRSFTPRQVARLAPRIRAITTELIDGFVERGEADLFAELAAPLPTTVIAELLGVPAADRAMFKEKSTAVATSVSPGGRENEATAALELIEYLGHVFEEKRRHPGDDLMSALLAAEVDGRRLDPPELLGFAFLLLLAGNETTTNLISNGALLLDRSPDQRARLLADRSLVARAVEEILRFESPVQGVERIVTRDLEWDGQRLGRGEKVFLLLGSANRDERAFPAPESFDVGREPNRHLAFGLGTHFCLGASLARLEARIAWEEMLDRLPDYRIAGGVERLRSGIFRGLLRVPIAFEPGPRLGTSAA